MIGFYWAKMRGDEATLSQYSRHEDEIRDRLSGRSIAIVGNARALSETLQGRQIDAAEIVIRLNNAPMPNTRSHGTRTDWLAMSTPVPRTVINAHAPSLLLWMPRKRKRLPWRIARDSRFFLNPREEVHKLASIMGAAPTTGAMMIDLVVRSKAGPIKLHGFDFFASKSLSGRRDANQVPHDFDAERRWALALAENDQRLTIVPPNVAH